MIHTTPAVAVEQLDLIIAAAENAKAMFEQAMNARQRSCDAAPTGPTERGDYLRVRARELGDMALAESKSLCKAALLLPTVPMFP